MQLSEKEQAVIASLELDARRPIQEVAKSTGLTERVVRYHQHKLYERGVMAKPGPFVNMYRLGFLEYVLYLSLRGENASARDNLVTFLLQCPHIPFAHQTGGDYQYAVGICIDDPRLLPQIVNQLVESTGNQVSRKSIGMRTAFYQFNRKYLYSGKNPPEQMFHYSTNDQKIDHDKVNLKLLEQISLYDGATLADLSRHSGLPIATVERHRRALENHQIIQGYRHRLAPESYGMHSYRLLVELHGFDSSLRQAFVDFCSQHRWIVHLQEWLGSWDFVIGVEVDQVVQIVQVTDDLYRHFGPLINNTSSYLIYSWLKSNQYNFSTSQGNSL